jgi:hypothetical protein
LNWVAREARTVKIVRSFSTLEKENSLDCCSTVAAIPAGWRDRARAWRIARCA